MEASKIEVKDAHKLSRETIKHEDFSLVKNRENILRRETKKAEKEYYRRKLQGNLGKWKTLRVITQEEEKTLLRVIQQNKPITSPRQLAQVYTEQVIKKLTDMKKSLPSLTILPQLICNKLVKRNTNNMKIK